MASHSSYRTVHPTLVANTVDTVTLDLNWTHVEIVNWGPEDRIYFTVDGEDPDVAGNDTDVAGPNGGSVIRETPSSSATVVRLKCISANEYSVIGF